MMHIPPFSSAIKPQVAMRFSGTNDQGSPNIKELATEALELGLDKSTKKMVSMGLDKITIKQVMQEMLDQILGQPDPDLEQQNRKEALEMIELNELLLMLEKQRIRSLKSN